MKKLVFSVMSLLLLFVLIPQMTFAAADSSIQLFINGKKLTPEVAPRKIGDYSMVPVRIVSEELGANVKWNQALQKVTVEKTGTTIELNIGSSSAKVNGETVPIDSQAKGKGAAPVLISGNTLLPVRFVAERLGVNIVWDDATQSVYMTKNPESPKAPLPAPGAPIVLPDKPAGTTPSPSSSPGTASNGTGSAIGVPTSADSAKYTELSSISMVNDQLVIQAAGPIASKTFKLTGPDRLVIDIPGVKFSSQVPAPAAGQMGLIASVNPLVDQIRYAMNAPDTSTVRIVVDLKTGAGYKVIEDGKNGKLVLSLTDVLSVTDTPKYKVVLDAGHGDQDPGAISLTGRKEKDFNLAMVLKVKKLLDQEPLIETKLTRSDDTFVPLDGRVDIANNYNADAFVSIHANNYLATSTGTETYYWRDESLPLAQILHQKVVAAAGLPDRNVRQNDYRVITKTTMPAVLLEIGYLSNASDEAKLYNEDFQNRVAAAIVAGIKQFLKIN